MPSKFVANTAEKMGVSLEHAESVWADAKKAVKKGKRQGSWYWGKVVTTFKRMMGLKENLSFSEFSQLLETLQLNEEQLNEVKALTFPKAAANFPKIFKIGNGFYAKHNERRALKHIYYIYKFMDNEVKAKLYLANRSLKTWMWQLNSVLDGSVEDPLDKSVLGSRMFDVSSENGTEEEANIVKQNFFNVEKMAEWLKVSLSGLNEDKVKASYVKGLNAAERKDMKKEISKYGKMDHKDKAAYPDDWTADQKYKERLKKKGKTLPKSKYTDEYKKRYG